jgi:acyl-CoA synthetase (AMP-forming)/AMP-acid ligase II
VTLARSRDLTLGTLLEHLAEFRADRMLAEEPDGLRLTYGAAADVVARAATALRASVTPGERVLVDGPDGYGLFLGCLAVCRAGGVAVPVNSRMTPDEISLVVEDADAQVRVDDVWELAAAGERGPAVPVHPASVAALLYTSGTTGQPKGARLTHTALIGAARWGALMPEGLLERGCVTGMPVAHIAGLTMLLLLATIGIPVYLLPHFRPLDALDAIERRRPMLFIGVPAMFRMMLEAGGAERDLSSVRLWASGSDSLSDEIVALFRRKGAAFTIRGRHRSVGRAAFVDGYGMVELGGAVALRVFLPLPVPGRGLLRALHGQQLRIVDTVGQEVHRGEVGELEVRGPGIMLGYHRHEAADSDVFTLDGWLRTGDLARRHGFGFFELAGRKKDVIKHGGFSVSSAEVQRVLASHPAVADAAVVGVPDERMGEVPAAAVQPRARASVTSEELRSFAARRLSDYKVPRQILVVDALPYTGTGKVSEVRLKAMLARAAREDAP